MACLLLLVGLCIAVSSGEDPPRDVADFLANLQELVPERYEGDVEKENLYVDVKAGFKLRSSGAPNELGLPVSEDVVLSIRRSAETEDNTLKRNDVDEVPDYDALDALQDSPTAAFRNDARNYTGYQILYFLVVYGIGFVIVSAFALILYSAVRMVRHERARAAAAVEEEEEGAGEQPGPSNLPPSGGEPTPANDETPKCSSDHRIVIMDSVLDETEL